MTNSEKRGLLLASRFRYSEEVEGVRDATLDDIVLNAIYARSGSEPLTFHGILDHLKTSDICISIDTKTLSTALKRLCSSKLLDTYVHGSTAYYSLSERELQRAEENKAAAERALSRIIDRLFSAIVNEENRETISQTFLSLLARIFSQIGSAYAQALTGKDGANLLDLFKESRDLISSEIAAIALGTEFSAGVMTFFRDTDPEYDRLKWSLVSHYYSCKLLGLDGAADYFSRDMFSGAVFWVDTNVVLNILNPAARHHNKFKALNNSLKELGSKLQVSKATMQELLAFVQASEQEAKRTFSTVPVGLEVKTSGFFYDLYRELKMENPDITVDAVFAPFYAPEENLESEFGVTTVETSYIDRYVSEPDKLQIMECLHDLSIKYRNKRKSEANLEHDVHLISLVADERRETKSDKVWILTLDTSLPGYSRTGAGEISGSLAICLDNLVSYLGPMACRSDDDVADFASLFAEAVANNYFPQNKMYDIGDFAAFTDIELEVNRLPIEVIEDALKHIGTEVKKGYARNNKASVRAYALRKYFASDANRYSHLLAEKDNQIEVLKAEADIERLKRDEDIEILRRDLERLGSRLESQEKNHAKKMQELLDESLNTKFKLRLPYYIVLMVIVVGLSSYSVYIYSAEPNLLKAISGSWALLSAAWVSLAWIIYFIAPKNDKERIKKLLRFWKQ